MESLIEEAYRFEDALPHQEASPCRLVDLRYLREGKVQHALFPVHRVSGEHLVHHQDLEGSRDECREGSDVEPPLGSAVDSDELSSRRRRLGMRVHEMAEILEGRRQGLDVAVEKEKIFAVALAVARVRCSGEPQVVPELDDLHATCSSACQLDAGIGRAIVHDEDLEEARGSGLEERVQANLKGLGQWLDR